LVTADKVSPTLACGAAILGRQMPHYKIAPTQKSLPSGGQFTGKNPSRPVGRRTRRRDFLGGRFPFL